MKIRTQAQVMRSLERCMVAEVTDDQKLSRRHLECCCNLREPSNLFAVVAV